jgi:sulfite reductase beta subunit-like hemoprotein
MIATNKQNVLIKGWCPSLEHPMATGDGLLVRIPIKFGRVTAAVLRQIADLSIRYGNGHLDLSARGNLQLRGVSEQTYEPLRIALAKLGFEKDAPLAIITATTIIFTKNLAD